MAERHAAEALTEEQRGTGRHCLCCRLVVIAEHPDPEPPRVQRCTLCGRSWLVGALVPVDSLVLYVTQLALAMPQR